VSQTSPQKRCPQASGLCQRVAPPVGAEERHQARVLPQAGVDPYGRQVWRAGSWLMS
jgi:hypothetical protein